MMRGRDKAKKYKFILDTGIFMFGFFPRWSLEFFLACTRHTPGYLGLALRYMLLYNLCNSMGENVMVAPGSYFINAHNLSIGDNVSIHPLCYIDSADVIVIGNDVSIAHNCSLISFNHTYEDTSLPIRDNITTYGPIIIKSDVWLGSGVRVLANSSINERVVVAAGAVVRGELGAYGIYGGVPARYLKKIEGSGDIE